MLEQKAAAEKQEVERQKMVRQKSGSISHSSINSAVRVMQFSRRQYFVFESLPGD
jgi:hypothetical protein